MKSWLINVTRHHNVEDARPYSLLVEADDFQGAMVEGFCCVLEDILCSDPREQLDKIQEAVAKIAIPDNCDDDDDSEGVPLRLKLDLDEEEPDLYMVWHIAPRRPGADPNIGIGPGCEEDGKCEIASKYDNRWLTIKEWDGNPKRRAELAGLSKEQLIDLLVRCEAVS